MHVPHCVDATHIHVQVHQMQTDPPSRVEWLYAMDVHCNGLFVLILILHVLQ